MSLKDILLEMKAIEIPEDHQIFSYQLAIPKYESVAEGYYAEKVAKDVGRKLYLASLDAPTVIETKLESFPDGINSLYLSRSKITPVKSHDVVMAVPVYRLVAEPPADTVYCDWCKGYTHNDSRGHCLACGGPRGMMRWLS